MNKQKVLVERDIFNIAPEGALFLASTRAEVEQINKQAYNYLIVDKKRDHIAIWAYHTQGTRGTFDYTARLNALTKCPAPDSDNYHKWLGTFRNVIHLAIGSRVRYLLNKCPIAGLYQGALGTVVGFGIPPGNTIDNYRVMKNGKLYDLDIETAARRNLEVPLVFVEMDKKDGFKSAWPNRPGVICFKAEQVPSKVNGHYRFMLPLLPAHARTYHSAQGLTAFCGVVLYKPMRKAFALMYVGISRIKNLAKLHLMQYITNDDFKVGDTTFRNIEAEMERLRSLPKRIL